MKTLKELVIEMYYEPTQQHKILQPAETVDIEKGSHEYDLHERLKNHYKFDKKPFSEIFPILHYTDDSTHINDRLHYLHNFNSPASYFKNIENKNHWDLYVSPLDDVTTKHKAPESFHVYTGIQESPKNLFDKKKGSITGIQARHFTEEGHLKAVLPAFTSTSLNANVAKGFSSVTGGGKTPLERHLLKIHIPEGSTHGAYIAHHSEAGEGEREFLMKRGTKLHIHPQPETFNDHVYNIEGHKIKHKVHVWHAKIEE